jgi:hypothetical protein
MTSSIKTPPTPAVGPAEPVCGSRPCAHGRAAEAQEATSNWQPLVELICGIIERLAESRRAHPDLADVCFAPEVERFHRLGPHVLREIGASELIRHSIEATVELFARLDPAIIDAVGADRIPPMPLHRLRCSGDG